MTATRDVDAVVIGAGDAGLTAAATLQRAGLRTLLVERPEGRPGRAPRRPRHQVGPRHVWAVPRSAALPARVRPSRM
ncbi:FAD-binding protein [Streptomyces sp. S.PNR 29]|uniref:FAD-binding protein n=1 Tax=Streptomyces sp. S.PNR 29 TaxID=2973805 RepID=UPI0025B06CB1|nr:FAD-binding protein [Streptomyces sp. S.PNR 29]MDN0198562.1 FAD-binding protein [Streptomyces sp. S.PNR 29]